MAQKCCCMRCKRELGDTKINDDGTCPHEGCESRSFVYSDGGFDFNEEGVVCTCGSKEFQNVMHMDMKTKAINNYKCDCGNIIGTEYYREASSPMMEDY